MNYDSGSPARKPPVREVSGPLKMNRNSKHHTAWSALSAPERITLAAQVLAGIVASALIIGMTGEIS